MIATNDRRMQILTTLIERKQETMSQLAFELGVSRMTIYRDIQVLSCSYPITTFEGGGGCVKIAKEYKLGMKYFTYEQTALLEKLSESLTDEELEIMNSILKTFKRPVVVK